MPSHALRRWAIALVVPTALAFSSALRAPFVFDDLQSIVFNPSIQRLIPPNDLLSPPQHSSVAGRPVVNVTFGINYALNDVFGISNNGPLTSVSYHVVNVLLHLACGLLLFGVVRRTCEHRWPPVRGKKERPSGDAVLVAGVTALIWLLHPIQTEAIDYVVQRTEILVSLFYLATLLASIRAWETEGAARRNWLLVGVVSCALGMGSKEVMVTAPIVVLLYDGAFRADSWKSLWANRERRWFYLALFATIGIVIASLLSHARTRSVGFNLGITWYEYFYSQAWAVLRYLRLIVWPVGLTFDYGDQPIRGWQGIPGLVILGAAFVATLVLWVRGRREQLWLGFLGAWFFLLLAPSSSIVPIRTEIAAERRVYLASAAVIVLAVLAFHRWATRAGWNAVRQRLAFSALAAVLAIGTFMRGRVYADTGRLYADSIEKTPNNARAYVGAGLALFDSGVEHFAEAEALFKKATALDSNSFMAWQVLGVVAYSQNRWQEAADAFSHALRIQPDNLDAAAGLSKALVELKRADEAIPHVDRLGHRDLSLLWSLGTLLTEEGRGPLALKYLELAAAQQPPPAVGLALMSVAYAESGRVNEARQAAQTAVAGADRSNNAVRIYLLAGRAMRIAKLRGEARFYIDRALELAPNLVAARQELASLEPTPSHLHSAK